MHVTVGGLRHQRRLVEAGQEKLELAGIRIDVANGEDGLRAGLELRGIHGDQVLGEIEAEIRDRPELHGQPEERQEGIALDVEGRTVGPLYDHRIELAVAALKLGRLAELEADKALLLQ